MKLGFYTASIFIYLVKYVCYWKSRRNLTTSSRNFKKIIVRQCIGSWTF